MSSQFNFRTLIVCVMVFSLVMVGLIPIPIGRSQASNNSLPHSLTLSVNASSEKPGLQAKPFDEATRARVNETPGKSSLSFEENRGGMDRHVKYVSRGTGYTLFLTTTEAVVVWQNESQPLNPSDAQSAIGNRQSAHPKPMLLRMKLAGASLSPAVKGGTRGGGRPNYAGGNDAEQRQPDVARYERVRYATVYPGIDVIYYGQQRQLAYDFVVA